MKVIRTASAAFTVAFENEQELADEHRTNLALGALRLSTGERAALNATLLLTLRGPWGGETFVKATVVMELPDGMALALDGNPEEQLLRLMARPAGVEPEPPAEPEPPLEEAQPVPAIESTTEKKLNAWDQMRSLSQMEKMLLAVKADRAERALLLQDNDPRVLMSLLRNPRLTIEEVARLAKSTFVTYQIAEAILGTAQWMANLDVRLGLIHNPKTPSMFAMRILPTLPVSEIRTIARAGTNMALKQAALRRLQGSG